MHQVITHHFVQLDPDDDGSEVEMAVGVVVDDGHPAVTRNPRYFARLNYSPDEGGATAATPPTTRVRRAPRRGSATHGG
jgi:hypothetical protein